MEEQSLVEPKSAFKHFKRKQKISPPRVGRVVRLGKNERTIPFTPDVVQEMFSCISGEDLVAYPEPEPLYEQLSAWLAVSRHQLLLFNGSDAAMKALFEVYVSEGEEIVSLAPAYHGYTLYSRMYGARFRAINYNERLEFDHDEFLDCITPATRLVIIANPDAVGAAIESSYLQCIVEKAASVGALALIDEAYHHFCAQTMIGQINHFDNLIVSRSFSKAFGIAGVRLGFFVAHPTIIQELYKVRLNNEIPAVTVKIGQFLLERSDIMQAYVESVKQSRTMFVEHLQSLGFSVHPSEANFVMVLLPTFLEVADLLLYCMARASIELTGQFADPLEHYIRVTIGPWEQMRDLVAVMHTYLLEHSPSEHDPVERV